MDQGLSNTRKGIKKSMRPADIQLGGTAGSLQDVERLHQLGLSFAEISIPKPEEFFQYIKEYKALKESLELEFICHGPREGDPNDKDNLEEIYLPKVLSLFPIMNQLAMRLLTIHLWLDPRFVRPEVLRYKGTFLKRVLKESVKWGIPLCIENLSESANHMERFFLEHPRLNMTLDLAHAQLLTKRNRSYGFIEKWMERIQHVHLHDNRGGDSHLDDLHLPPGEGTIDLRDIVHKLKEAGYNKTVTLELTPHEIEGCLDRVNDLFAGPPPDEPQS